MASLQWFTECDLLAVRRHVEKLAHLEARGIRTGYADAVQHRNFDIAVECTGNPKGFAIALKSLRPRGTLVLKSTYAEQLSLDASALVVDEITLIGSRCGLFPEILKLLTAQKMDVSGLIQTRYPLADGLTVFSHAQQRGVLKVLLKMQMSE